MEREQLGSRLGFILLSAGCAIGIGNVWKFPYMVGQHGGGIFVLCYIFFLVVLGLPIMTMEFSVGRASRKSPIRSFQVLEKPGQKWHIHGVIAMIGNYLLMMFYSVVSGWMLYYFYLTATGAFEGASAQQVQAIFDDMLGQPSTLIICMAIVVIAGMVINSMGLQKGLEPITKVMMISLMVLMLILAVNSILLDGGQEGLAFYLQPDIERAREIGLGNTIVGAMNQAFFTLSLGIGSMAIFGSYIGKDHALLGESIRVGVLDTFVALTAGFIIFPACSAFGVEAGSGPKLIFLTLPNIFNHLPFGRLWGSLFFIFLTFAAFSTVLAVFENIISCGMDLTGCSRKKSCMVNLVLLFVLSVPCALGFNVWSNIQPFGAGSTIMDLEDFLVSNILLPLGSLIYLMFCTSRHGWGWNAFREEANTGKGVKMPNILRGYCTYVLPIIVLVIFVIGIRDKFF